METTKPKYIIVLAIDSPEVLKDFEGNKPKFYETEEDARIDCGFFELDGAFVCEIKYWHKERE